jgi:DNA-directed RNA polymerase specialized sigma24 family protein
VAVNEGTGTDAELLQRLASGDQRALSVAFDRHAAAVTRYAWAIAPSRMDVEEIVQDTFVTAWRRAGEITIADTSLLPWLLVTCRHLAFNQNRRQARNRADALPDEHTTDLAGLGGARSDADAAREELRWVLDEIERLPGPQRRRGEATRVPKPGTTEEGGDRR